MSVLIKGVHIDLNAIKVCGDCPFCYDYMYCLATDKTFCEHNIDCVDEKADWCPLIALPEHHGRLIDADELIFRIKCHCGLGGYLGELFEMMRKFLIDGVNKQPTIIEAEGQDDEKRSD